MAKLETQGKDSLLESFGYNFRHKGVKLSIADKAVLNSAIVVLKRAADLWAEVNDEYDKVDNPYRITELEIREALDY